jgi:hypothetical protein
MSSQISINPYVQPRWDDPWMNRRLDFHGARLRAWVERHVPMAYRQVYSTVINSLVYRLPSIWSPSYPPFISIEHTIGKGGFRTNVNVTLPEQNDAVDALLYVSRFIQGLDRNHRFEINPGPPA